MSDEMREVKSNRAWREERDAAIKDAETLAGAVRKLMRATTELTTERDRLVDEIAHMRQVINEELRCLNHLRDELTGRIDGEAGRKFFPVIGRAMDRLNEARDYRG